TQRNQPVVPRLHGTYPLAVPCPETVHDLPQLVRMLHEIPVREKISRPYALRVIADVDLPRRDVAEDVDGLQRDRIASRQQGIRLQFDVEVAGATKPVRIRPSTQDPLRPP